MERAQRIHKAADELAARMRNEKLAKRREANEKLTKKREANPYREGEANSRGH
jgi:hypothetical protein